MGKSVATTITSPIHSISSSVEEHDHSDRTGPCPFTAPKTTTTHAAHAWCPMQPTDIRSPCPALNTLANHGYLNRSGKNIYIWDIALALYRGYALTMPFSIFLCVGTLYLIKQWNPFAPMDLARIGVHGGVEHNASVVHNDVDIKDGLRYGSHEINPRLVQRFKDEVEANGTHEMPYCVDSWDIARARIRREKECGPIDPVHQEIARGEMAIALRMWDRERLGKEGNATGIPLDWILEWLGSERLPSEWMERLKTEAVRRTGFFDTVSQAKEIKAHVEKIRDPTKK